MPACVLACLRALNGNGTIFNPAATDSEEQPGRTDSERALALSALCPGQVSHKEEPLDSLQVRVSGTYVSNTVSEIQVPWPVSGLAEGSQSR